MHICLARSGADVWKRPAGCIDNCLVCGTMEPTGSSHLKQGVIAPCMLRDTQADSLTLSVQPVCWPMQVCR